MSLLFKAPRTSQPQGAVELDWSNPLAHQLCHAVVGFRDYAAGVAVNQNGHLLTTTSGGIGNKASANASLGLTQVSRLVTSNAFTGAGDFTVFAYADPVASSLRSNLAGSACGLGGGSVFETYLMVNTSGSSFTTSSGTLTASISGVSPIDIPGAIDGKLKLFCHVRSSGNLTVYAGDLSASGAFNLTSIARPENIFSTSGFHIGGWGGNEYTVLLSGAFNRALSSAEVKAFSDNPWQLFRPQARTLWIPGTVSAGGNSQSLGITLDGITVATSQALQHAQSLTATLDGVSVAANQTAGHAQAFSVTLDSITASISQTAGAGISQSLTATLDGVTVTASQTLSHSQALTATLDGITVAASQVIGSGTYQSLAVTLDDVSVSATQALTHDQIFEATLDSIGVSASQVVRHGQALAWALDDVTVRVTQVGALPDYNDILNSSTVVWLHDTATSVVIYDAPSAVTLRDSPYTATI